MLGFSWDTFSIHLPHRNQRYECAYGIQRVLICDYLKPQRGERCIVRVLIQPIASPRGGKVYSPRLDPTNSKPQRGERYIVRALIQPIASPRGVKGVSNTLTLFTQLANKVGFFNSTELSIPFKREGLCTAIGNLDHYLRQDCDIITIYLKGEIRWQNEEHSPQSLKLKL